MGTGQWTVSTTMTSVLTWQYQGERPELRALYEKAKREQWNATTHLNWAKMWTRTPPSSTTRSIPTWHCYGTRISGVS